MFKKLLAFSAVFILLFSFALAQEPLKVLSINFDNADNIFHLAIKGEAKDVKITRGTLPDRVYYDITNAIITFGAKTWELKNSELLNVKISQFEKDPAIIRIVVIPKDVKNLDKIKLVQKNNQIFISYGKEAFQSSYYNPMYEKTPDEEILAATVAREETVVKIATEEKQTEENELKSIFNAQSQKLVTGTLKEEGKDTGIKSLYYLNGIQATQNGIIVKGVGIATPSSPFVLPDPSRVVFDIHNTNVAPELRNQTFKLNDKESAKIGQFDLTTARIVITTPTPEKYKTIISSDIENFIITTDEKLGNAKLTDNIGTMTKMEWNNDKRELNFNFSQPVVSSCLKEEKTATLEFYNAASYSRDELAQLNKISKFENLKIQQVNKDRIKVTVPTEGFAASRFEISADAMSVKLKFSPKASIISNLRPIIKPSKISSYYKVVIDAGHGGEDVGAMRGTVLEKDITLKVSQHVANLLTNEGVHVEMTRRSDATVSLQDRVAFSNKIEPDLFVSIHVNATVKEDIKGIETHWYHDHDLMLAEEIHDEMKKKIKTPDRGLFKSQFYVINHTEAPSVLVEIGFISNKDEREQIITDKRQKETAKAISQGIMNYLKNRGK